MSLLASTIITDAQLLVNDVAKSVATDSLMLSWLKNAIRDLIDECEKNDIGIIDEVSTNQTISIGSTTMPSQPTDIIVPIRMFERLSGSTLPEDFTMMERVDFLPNRTAETTLKEWEYREGVINFVGASTARQVQLDYHKLMTNVTATSDPVAMLNTENFLSYRTAELFARFSTRDIELAEMLKADAQKAMDSFLSVMVKNRQNVPYRQRPYNSNKPDRARN